MSKIFELEALGTKWWFKFFNDYDLSENLKNIITNDIREFENLYSRFKPDSLLSKLNNEKFLENPPADLYLMIKKAEELKTTTNGYFDIAVGAILERMGYGIENPKSKDTRSKIQDPKSKIQIQKLKIKNKKLITNKTKIQIPVDVRIDLGGIGKGYLIEKLSKLIKSQGIKYFLINGGGDIYVTSENNNSVKILLENPFDTSEAIGQIDLKNSGFACSSSNKRKWKVNNKEVHHLINPKEKKEANNIAAIFTQAKSVLNADLAATAIFVAPEKLRNKIARSLKTEYLIIFNDKSFCKSQNFKGKLFK